MKKIMLALTLIFIISTAIILYNRNADKAPTITPQPKPTNTTETTETTKTENVDYKAKFAIYTNGTFRIFTAAMYHDLSEDAYITAENPNTIIIKKSGTTWNDFFKTLPFQLTNKCIVTGTKETFCTNEQKQLKFYLNGQKVNNLLDMKIQNGDEALISYGAENEIVIKTQLQYLAEL